MDPMLTGVLIVLASILILSTARFIHGKKKRSRNLPPGSFGWPVVGESLEFLRLSREGTPEKFVADRVRKYKSGVFKTSLMGEAVAVLSGPAGNKFLFSNGNKLVATWWPASVQKLLGVCLTTSAGEEGKKMKKLMSYFVSPAALQQLYIKDMDFVTQQHLQAHWHEQREIASSKEVGEFLNWNDIQKMKYSWNVASEVMRLYPPVFGAFREALEDISYEGYDIPKGWKFYWNAPITHLNKSLFQDPMNFDPLRFEGDGPPPYTYVPFGGGPRMCLGKEFARLEILVFLPNLIKRFRWSLLVPDEKVQYDPMPIPVEGLPICLHQH
ncbi:unnamed protein product [Cuscuta epithymum]|uniref:Uncharacterized protein n=1 Tax=Cuscuta epithymum TaxID=186058 RepID=A0AAV0G3U4_9ASTE|nr:unnamed protein product [Cuscuta epithymum]CAH9142556.1 unnamed protein product [Cuscuta epithymum]